MQDSISKTIEITDAKANTFKHFGLVVAALCISIRPWNIQCVEYLLRPVVVGFSNSDFGSIPSHSFCSSGSQPPVPAGCLDRAVVDCYNADSARGHSPDSDSVAHFRHAGNKRCLTSGVVFKGQRLEWDISVSRNMKCDSSQARVQLPVPAAVAAVCTFCGPLIWRSF